MIIEDVVCDTGRDLKFGSTGAYAFKHIEFIGIVVMAVTKVLIFCLGFF